MKQYIGWQNYALSGASTVVVLIGLFQLKLALGHSISISARTLCIGSVVAMLVSVMCLLTKKTAILCMLSALALGAWVIMRGDHFAAAAILGGGSVGLIASIPFFAGILSRTSKPAEKNVP
jgi:hypothetical protein